MRKEIRALLALVLVLGLILPVATPAMAQSIPSVSTDKEDYTPGETVIISGSGFEGNVTLVVRVTRPDGSIVTGDGSFTEGSDTVTTDAGLSFLRAFGIEYTPPPITSARFICGLIA